MLFIGAQVIHWLLCNIALHLQAGNVLFVDFFMQVTSNVLIHVVFFNGYYIRSAKLILLSPFVVTYSYFGVVLFFFRDNLVHVPQVKINQPPFLSDKS